jgi:hypothetical protein
MRARIRRQLADQQDTVIGSGGAMQEFGDKGARQADLIRTARKRTHTNAQR